MRGSEFPKTVGNVTPPGALSTPGFKTLFIFDGLLSKNGRPWGFLLEKKLVREDFNPLILGKARTVTARVHYSLSSIHCLNSPASRLT